MSAKPVISFESVSLSYKTESSRRTLKSTMVDTLVRNNREGGVKFQINDFTVSINHGEQVGIIGRNGSGKSTFLKLVAGVLIPDKGSIAIDGTITPLIDIGAGMHPDLTCEDNIYLSGAYLGLSRKQMTKHFDDIVSWAEVENVLGSQFHSISTGTQSRLAFSVATALTPDIVLVDEVLSVGDIGFQRKSKTRMKELKTSGSAILIVSHDLEYLANAVHRVIWIRDGKLHMDGSTEEVLTSYKASF